MPGFAREKVCRARPAQAQGLETNVWHLRRLTVSLQLVEYSEWQPLVLNDCGASRATLTCDSGEVPPNSETSEMLRESLQVAGVGASLNSSHKAEEQQGHAGSCRENRKKAEHLLGVRSYVVAEKPAGWELWTVGW